VPKHIQSFWESGGEQVRNALSDIGASVPRNQSDGNNVVAHSFHNGLDATCFKVRERNVPMNTS
jgi:hypothetical protein